MTDSVTRIVAIFIMLPSAGCPRSGEPVAPEADHGDTREREPPRKPWNPRFEVGWAIATSTENGDFDFHGPPEFESWMAGRGPIENIWIDDGVCVRTPEGISCKAKIGAESVLVGPVEFPIELPTAAAVIDVDWSFSVLCAVTAEGELWCSFGDDAHSKPLRRLPVAGVRDIEIEDAFGCARLEDGSAKCWSGVRDRASWPASSRQFSNTRDIAVGHWFGCVLDHEGVPRCFDDEDGEFTIQGMPPLVEIDGNWKHLCGRSDISGEVWCWEYRTGDPTRIAGLPAVDDLALDDHVGCVLGDGEVWCWGWDLSDVPPSPSPLAMILNAWFEPEPPSLPDCGEPLPLLEGGRR